MLIAIDYDGTFTADPLLWTAFIENAKARGHEVVCVTMRYEHEAISVPCEVIYTARKAKMKSLGSRIVKVWIDDNPMWLFEDAA